MRINNSILRSSKPSNKTRNRKCTSINSYWSTITSKRRIPGVMTLTAMATPFTDYPILPKPWKRLCKDRTWLLGRNCKPHTNRSQSNDAKTPNNTTPLNTQTKPLSPATHTPTNSILNKTKTSTLRIPPPSTPYPPRSRTQRTSMGNHLD